jgi:transposase
VQADQDTVRDAIHRFNEIGLACLDPQRTRGRPRLLSPDQEDFVVATATTRPAKLGQPFTRWSIRKLAAYLGTTAGQAIRIGREALCCLLGRHGVTFQRTKTWKESIDPERDVKLDRIEEALEKFPDRTPTRRCDSSGATAIAAEVRGAGRRRRSRDAGRGGHPGQQPRRVRRAGGSPGAGLAGRARRDPALPYPGAACVPARRRPRPATP